MAPHLCLVKQISGCHQPHYMNYSLYLLSEYFRCSEQHISLPLAGAVCNTLAVCVLTKGNVSCRVRPGPDRGRSLLSGLLAQLAYSCKTRCWADTPLAENPNFTSPNAGRLKVT